MCIRDSLCFLGALRIGLGVRTCAKGDATGLGSVSYTHLDVYKRQLWQSKVDGHLTCAQTSPGEGWIRFTGPFRDAGCRVAHDAPVNRR